MAEHVRLSRESLRSLPSRMLVQQAMLEHDELRHAINGYRVVKPADLAGIADLLDALAERLAIAEREVERSLHLARQEAYRYGGAS